MFKSCDNPADITFEPVVKWHWQSSSIMPSHAQVMSMPLVVPLEDTNGDGQMNQDDTPSVVFNTFRGGNYNSDGVLRAISGKDGHDLWAVTDLAYRTAPGSTLAAADIDNDGKIEIVSVKSSGYGVIAFEHTGEFKWQVSQSVNVYTGIAIADLEGDGKPEIVAAGTVLNGDGSIKWQVPSNYSLYGYTGIADINLDNQQEVILGGSAYSAQGQLLWQNSTVGAGMVGVGNFNADKYPEIVVVSNGGKVSLVSHTGELIWMSYLPDLLGRGAPTIADMDGDNQLEIGVAGAYDYVVFDTNGSILWQSRVNDTSSRVTGSSVFDFNGDGQAEILYNDQYHFRVYRGKDGKILFQMSNTSGTLMELPVIADVDNDNHADVVLASNSYAFGLNTGIIALQGKNNDWMNTRKIWNQHTYHITNINDDGTVPRLEKPSWLHNNTYRSIPYLSTSGQTCVRPATCQVYALQDTEVNNTQFFTVTVSADEGNINLAQELGQPLNYQINQLGSVYEGYDIEAMAIDPKTNLIYVASGNNTWQDIPKGHLYVLDAEIGKLFSVGDTGFKEISDLAFSPTGVLYGYAKRVGIITIELETGKGEVWLPSEQMVEGLALAKVAEKRIFYGAVNQDLWKFDTQTGELTIKCDNLPAETEALETLPNNLLIFTTHQEKSPHIHLIDATTCEIFPQLKIPLGAFNDVEGLAMPTNACN